MEVVAFFMEDFEQETIDFDTAFNIECIIYNALYNTISRAIEEEMAKDDTAPVIAKETMLKNILSRNIDGMEEEQYLTEGPGNKVYLCGSWLLRSVLSTDGTYKPMGDHIKANADCTNIVFLPNKTGSELRKELWPAKCEGFSSYDLPKDCRIEVVQERMPMGMPGMMRPPAMMQGMQGGMPPLGRPPFTPPTNQSEVIATLTQEIRATLEATISQSIDDDALKDGIPQPAEKAIMLKNIVAHNIEEMEKNHAIFPAADGKIYVCGEWLLRQVCVGDKKLPMIAHLKTKFHQYANVDYRPDKLGTQLQAELGA